MGPRAVGSANRSQGSEVQTRGQKLHRCGTVPRQDWSRLARSPGTFRRQENHLQQVRRWSYQGHWAGIFKALQIRVDEDGVIIDSSIVRAHQDAAGGKGGSNTMHWVVLEVDSLRRSTPSPTRKGGRSTSKSRPVSSTSRRSPKPSSELIPEGTKSSGTRRTTRTRSEPA